MVFTGGVGEIDSGDVHASIHHPEEGVDGVARWADGTDDA